MTVRYRWLTATDHQTSVPATTVATCASRFSTLLTARVPAADAKISQKAMDETFYLTNIAPQVGDGFNRHCG